jgi:hypothetical protein
MDTPLSYGAIWRIMVRSGWETLQILDRQARKDTSKILKFGQSTYRILTSPDAIKTYRILGQLIVIIGMLAIALFLLLRDIFRSYNTTCLELPSEQPDVISNEAKITHLIEQSGEQTQERLSESTDELSDGSITDKSSMKKAKKAKPPNGKRSQAGEPAAPTIEYSKSKRRPRSKTQKSQTRTPGFGSSG